MAATDVSQFPTLRYGDQSADGWVEYLQNQLSLHAIAAGVDPDALVTGVFDDNTLEVVRFLQHSSSLQFEDGVVGYETWAIVHGNEPGEPGTDGRDPHSFTDEGTHVVTLRDPALTFVNEGGGRQWRIALMNVGTTTITDRDSEMIKAQARVGTPTGDVLDIVLFLFFGEDGDAAQAGPGEFLVFKSEVMEVTEGEWTCEAYLPDVFGGDYLSRRFDTEVDLF